jgi:FxsC-like protein
MTDNSSCFFLSYAHSPPLNLASAPDPDDWVEEFFADLNAAVERHPSWRPGLGPGFYDRQIPAGANWKESISRALRSTQVFVPLYSSGYVERTWPATEWVRFRARMQHAGIAEPEHRFVPVLWTPLFSAKPPDFDAALALGADQPDYADNGLQALMRFRPYQDSYRAVLNNLANRIVTVAHESPLQPSDVPDIDMMESEFLTKAHLAIFSVEIAAPTAPTLPGGLDRSQYGDSGAEWSPFPKQRLPLGEYVRQIAERLDFDVDVSNLGEHDEGKDRRPGVILIDPWYIADDDRRSLLEANVSHAPEWVLPLVVVGPPQDTLTDSYTQQVLDMVRTPGRCARSLEAIDTMTPKLIAEAERRYFRNSGGTPSTQRAMIRGRQRTRPSLRGPIPPVQPKTEPDIPGKTTGD